MKVSMRQVIWKQGWTPDTIRRASAALTSAVAEPPVALEPEDRELAVELSRWLRYACEYDVEDLARGIQHYRPPWQNAPHWDALAALLVVGKSASDVIVRLTERYADPAQTLIAFLGEVAPRGSARGDDADDDAVRAAGVAYETLLALGATEGLGYVLSRLDLFNWGQERELESLVRSRAAALKSTALGTWPSFNWAERFAMGAAGFTFFAVIGPVVEAMLGRLRTAARGAPNISIEPTPDGAAHVRR